MDREVEIYPFKKGLCMKCNGLAKQLMMRCDNEFYAPDL